MAAPAASLLSPSATFRMAAFVNSAPCSSCKFPALILPSAFREVGSQLLEYPRRRDARRVMTNVSTVETPVVEETKECSLPTWAEFDIGKAPVFWKTMNGLPPTSGEKLTIFYNPAASNLVPNDDFGIAFNAIKLIFSFTNGTDWDGPYSLPFEVPKKWKNKPSAFFNEGLAEELGVEGACEKAIYPDSHVVIMRCAMVGNLSTEGGDRCNLDIVSGCTDPGSPNFNAFADVDDGSCPVDEELESEEK